MSAETRDIFATGEHLDPNSTHYGRLPADTKMYVRGEGVRTLGEIWASYAERTEAPAVAAVSAVAQEVIVDLPSVDMTMANVDAALAANA